MKICKECNGSGKSQMFEDLDCSWCFGYGKLPEKLSEDDWI